MSEAIACALAQTYAHVEILVAPDDGTTYQWLRRQYKSPQIRIIPPGSSFGTGAGATRNRALDAASGDFIATLDADDLIPAGYIESLMMVALDEGAAVAPTRYCGWGVGNLVRSPPIHAKHLSLSGFAQLLASVHPLAHQSLEPGYCDGFAEDVIRDGVVIAKLGTVQVVDQVQYSCRIRQGSACSSGEDTERYIQQEYRRRIEQIRFRPTELGMHCIDWAARRDFGNLFEFRSFVSTAFSQSGADSYNAWVSGQEAALWDAFCAGLPAPELAENSPGFAQQS